MFEDKAYADQAVHAVEKAVGLDGGEAGHVEGKEVSEVRKEV